VIVEDDELFPDEYPNILVVPHRLADPADQLSNIRRRIMVAVGAT
jgi:hypothetical protein